MASSGEIFRNLAAAGAVTVATLAGSASPAQGAESSHSPDASGQGITQPGIMPSQSGEQFAFVNWPARGNHFDIDAATPTPTPGPDNSSEGGQALASELMTEPTLVPTPTVENGDETTVASDGSQSSVELAPPSTKLDLDDLMRTDGLSWKPVDDRAPQWKLASINKSPFPDDTRPYEKLFIHDGTIQSPNGTQGAFGKTVLTSAGFPYIGRGGAFLIKMDVDGNSYQHKGGFSMSNDQPYGTPNHRSVAFYLLKGGQIDVSFFDPSRSPDKPYITTSFANAFQDSDNLRMILGARLSGDGKNISLILPNGTLSSPIDLGDSSFFYSPQAVKGANCVLFAGNGYNVRAEETMLVRPQGR